MWAILSLSKDQLQHDKLRMSIEHRVITDEEFPNWRTLIRRAFNEHVHPDDIKRLRDDRAEMDRLFGAFDGNVLVGTGGTDSHVMTVPGGNGLPTAAIAYVSTVATHRRRGILVGTMRKLLEQAREREEPLAALWASQAGLYTRFGFGQATVAEEWQIDPAKSAFANTPSMPEMPGTGGNLRFVEHDEALRLMPGIWQQASKLRAGFLDRTERRWRYNFFDDERVRGGWSGLFHVVYENAGQPEGYATYRLRPDDPDEDDVMRMSVVECVAATDSAHAALWRFMFDVDLVVSVTVPTQPPDDPVTWMLADPRKLKRKPADGIWVRVIDPVKALSERTYSSSDRLVIEVDDRFIPSAGGVFEIEGSEDGADCRRTMATPDISFSASELGATYLGGTRLSHLERAGRVVEHAPGAIRRFDRMFTTERAPWCAHHF